MRAQKSEAWVTGIGLVTSLGEGLETHWAQLTSGNPPTPSVNSKIQAPYPVHPLVEFNVETQIPNRSDQRQMGPWQRLGTYTAGLALLDAGVAGNADLLAATNMIIAAGGGERDLEVDAAIMKELSESDNPGPLLNASLNRDLRPTLFLAQLSNLMAGNISIVHGVTDSSRTFMGEEMAGVSAIETAVAQIEHGQGEVFLVGGAYIAERADMMLLMEFGQALWHGEHGPVWSRRDGKGGMIMGSGSAFLVLESRQHAEDRGARPYARVRKVVSSRCNRQAGAARNVAETLLESLADQLPREPLAILSGCCGLQPELNEEYDFLMGLANRGISPAVRGLTTVLGSTMEAQFPVSVALASLAVSRGAFFDPFDTSGVERVYSGKPERVLISNWGHWRGESLALLDAPGVPLRGLG
jgi:3-oxoacyl-[acyl-carrier-protein] synthase II